MPPLVLLFLLTFSPSTTVSASFCSAHALSTAKVMSLYRQQRFSTSNVVFASSSTNNDGNHDENKDDTSFDFEATEVEQMEDLILSLSKEPTDDSRRSRVVSVFEGHDARFASLFDQVLIVVGDRVRLEAAAKAEQAQAKQEEENGDDDDDDDNLPSFPLPGQKSETELQLWALVDMMVQSKTIVKKAAGQLGSEGRFG